MGIVGAYDCDKYTVSHCLNEEYELDTAPPFPVTEKQCQDICLEDANCLRYKHTTNQDTGEVKCRFFTANYNQECVSVGGTLVSSTFTHK